MEDNNDIFLYDIFRTIEPPHGGKFNLIGLKLPSSQDYYFAAKWNELFNRYCSARIFLRKTQEEKWDYWFNPVDNTKTQKAFENIFKAELFETALINYNILVDLSWTMTYVSAEYAMYKFDADGNILNAKDICGMLPLEEAAEMLRKTENGVGTPHAEGNSFNYLKVMRPEFSKAIELIIDFWNKFSNNEIRNLYNFIKHKGKPLYKEIEEMRGGKTMLMRIGKDDYPSDIRDVQKMISLEKSIEDLIDFDNNELFPYIKELLNQLKLAVNPSPMTFI